MRTAGRLITKVKMKTNKKKKSDLNTFCNYFFTSSVKQYSTRPTYTQIAQHISDTDVNLL